MLIQQHLDTYDIRTMAVNSCHVLFVGHSMEAKCAVMNAVYGQKGTFRQFSCRRNMIVKTLKVTLPQQYTFNLTLTPNLNKTFWKANQGGILNHIKNRIVVYVEAADGVDVDDLASIKMIKKAVKNSPLILVLVSASKINLMKEVGEENTIMFKYGCEFRKQKRYACEIVQHIINAIQKKELFWNTRKPLEKDVKTQTDTCCPMPQSEELGLIVARPHTSCKPFPSLKSGDRSLYKKALHMGIASSNHVRVHVIGNQGVGKTTLVNRLQFRQLEKPPNPTENLEINRITCRCREKDGHLQWEASGTDYERELNVQRMAQAMSHAEKSETDDVFESRQKSESFGSEQIASGAEGEEQEEILQKQSLGESLSLTTSLETLCWDEDDLFGPSTLNSTEEIDADSAGYGAMTERLRSVIRKKTYTEGEYMYVSYWDHGGQWAYYATHQVFMSACAVYLLVIDLSKDLEAKIDDNLSFRTSILHSHSVADSIRFWMASIKAYTKDKNDVYASFMIVGTHKDKVTSEEAKEKFNKVRELLEEENIECIGINNELNAKNDEDLEALRNRVLGLGQSILNENVPAHWIELENAIYVAKTSGQRIITFNELMKIDSDTDAPIAVERELETFLEHLHYRGQLMYFPQDGEEGIIFLDPMILAVFLNRLLRQTGRPTDPKITVGWNRNGTLTQKFLEHIVKEMDIGIDTDMLVNALTGLYILHPTCNGQYFIPCLLPEKPNVDPFSKGSQEKYPSIAVKFTDAMPSFYHLLVAAMLRKRDLIEIDGKPRLFQSYAAFRVGPGYATWLVLLWEPRTLYIDIRNFSTTQQSLSSMNGYEIVEEVEDAIIEIIRTYRYDDISYDVRIECPEHKQEFLSMQHLKEGGNAMCSKGHCVQLEQAMSTFYKKEMREFEEPDLTEKPSDKILGRLAVFLVREDSLSLSRLLGMLKCIVTSQMAASCFRNPNEARLSILKLWRRKNHAVTTSRLCNLLKAGQDYTKDDLFRVVKDVEDRNTYDLEPEELQANVTERMIVGISQFLGENYAFVMLELGLTIVEVERERGKYMHNIEGAIIQLLMKWHKKQGPLKANLKVLLDAVNKVDGTLLPNIIEYVITQRNAT